MTRLGLFVGPLTSYKRNIQLWQLLLLLCTVSLKTVSCTTANNVYKFTIAEERPKGTVVGSIQKSGSNHYYLISHAEPKQDHFAIDQNSGVISTDTVIDRESIQVDYYNLTIFDVLSSKTYYALVYIQDINDNAPQFVGGNFATVALSEGHSFGYKIVAADRDNGLNSTQNYSIISGNIDDVFKLDTKRELSKNLYADLVLNTGKELDREDRDFYVLNISASDGGTPPRKDFLQLNVTVSDLNDNPPVFNSSNYTVYIREDKKPSTSIIKVAATDKDIGTNAKIYYSIINSDPNNEFSIDKNTGVISAIVPLDYETKKSYKLSIKAENSDSDKLLFSISVVNIIILDVNDNDPVVSVKFSIGGPYQVLENANIGEEVARVSVSDKDSGPNGDVNVTLEGGDGYFSMKYDVKKSESVIYVGRTLDREKNKEFILKASCIDNGNPPRETTKKFKINVGDVNDNHPKCERHVYNSRVIENATVNTVVATVSATDADYGVNAELVYSLSNATRNKPYGKWFTINPSTGVIKTALQIDREQFAQPVLIVIVSDKGTPPLRTNCTVIINITDTNDNDPYFNQSVYKASVPENSPSNSYVLHVYATDPDLGDYSLIKYSFPAHYSIPFKIGPDSGAISTVNSIDRETNPSYSFQVVAIDGGGRKAFANVTITITDKNDNKPVFKPDVYFKEVKEDAPVTTEIVTVTAHDADSELYSNVTYVIIAGNDDGLFAINSLTGVVTIAQKLDRETKDLHILTIKAADAGGIPSTNNATVNVTVLDVNDEPPVFEHPSYNYTVTENSQPEVIGTVTATSKDLGTNAIVTYSIIAGNVNNHFTINATGTIYLRTPLDHEKTPQVKLTVQAKDGGKPALFGYTRVNINVTDLNDNAPQFNGSYIKVFLPENTLPGHSFYKVKAVDPDSGSFGRISYKLVTNPGQLFQLQPHTGALSLQKPINFETDGRSYKVVIQAQDGGQKTSQVTLNITVVDVNDHAPVFVNSSYVVHVSEVQSKGTNIVKVSATDSDSGLNAQVTYSFKNSPDTANFGLKPDGWIYLKSMLDRETQDLYKLTVVASDKGLPTPLTSSVDVTIIVDDHNDNNPTFRHQSYIFYIQEGKPKGTLVDSVTATDKDIGKNAKITYKFETVLSEFTIDKDTGEIKTTKVLDREKKSSYSAIVVATDGGASTRLDKTRVTIVVSDVNDNSPSFFPSQYSEKVYEDVAVGTTLVKVTAIDKDEPGPNSEVRYSIVAGQQKSRVFSINDKTGAITVTSSLDREKKHRYILYVNAKDLGKPPRYTIAMVTVNVLDVNDNVPRFLNMTDFVNVPEKLPVGSNVTQVKAVDNDDGDNGKIEYEIVLGNVGNTFNINKTSGLITTRILLDFERQNRYQLKVTAKDMGKRQHTTYRWVNIYVLDANDNRPTFDKNPIIASVLEGVPINHTVKTIQARDDDSGSNSWILYSIVSQNPEQHFSIDPMSGAVRTISSIDRETISEYTLIVKATDQPYTQKDRLSSTATLKIIVLDVNDNKPVFVSKNRTFIMEDEPFNFEVITITAIDPDEGISSKVDYRIVSGDAGKFTLDPRTGALKKIGKLDYEAQRSYKLNISASDEGSPALVSYQLLTINVVDVNDNPPEFTQKLYNGTVSEGEAAGTPVLSVAAFDRDSGTNAELTYSIPSSALRKRFCINSTSGLITTNVTLDREEQGSYSFVVYATGSMYPFRVSTTNVQVKVLDKNDNPPKFSSSLVETKVTENSAAHGFYTITAKDLDDGLNAKVKYRLVSGNIGDAFKIEADTGELSTLKQLDREAIDKYTLTIEAKDIVQPFYSARCQVIVVIQDRNDNRPRFLKSKYTTVIPETTPRGSSILQVTASDKDTGSNGRVVYTLSNETYKYFSIDSQTGIISTESVFDTSIKSQFIFHCYVHDQGIDPKMDVVLITVTIQDMNTHSPVFTKTPYQTTVFRNASSGTKVITVLATDSDTNKTTNGKVTYRIKDQLSLFVLESNTGILKTSNTFNNPPASRHILYVIAQDHGQPAKSSNGIIEVLIGTVKDDPPVFVNKSTSIVSIPEDTATNGYITTVIARNNNNNPVKYNIISGNLDNAFAIHPDTGVLTVQASNKLDYETMKEYKLQLLATLTTGSSLNGYMTLFIRLTDTNDNRPVFHPSNIVAQLPEDTGGFAPRDVVMVTASDADSTSNAKLTYSIASGDDRGTFTINSQTGQMKTAKLLDRETSSSYHLVVKATDQGVPSLSSTCNVSVTVSDVNDNPPVFNVTKVINIPEDTRPGAVITIATATDADQDNQLVYSLKSASILNVFAVSRFTGAVSLLKSLDYETTKTYSIIITVSDGKHSSDVTLIIHVTDVNDNPPVFMNSSYELKITQTVRAGVPLLRVRATDKDSGNNGKLTYSFLQPIPEFKVNVTSGVISTRKKINTGIRDTLTQILVVATDRGNPSLRTFVYLRVLITGEPQFDRAQYTSSVPEDITVGKSVLTVKTTENPPSTPSARISFVIESGDPRDQFRIGQRSGIIRVKAPLDYETDKQYQLVIRAFDDVAPSNLVRVTALINVTDVNDMKPIFNQRPYIAQFKENIPKGTIMINVTASDGDTGTNAKVWYAIQSGDDENSFTIDRNTGCIRTIKELDYDSIKTHHLSVRATDQGLSVSLFLHALCTIYFSSYRQFVV